MKQIRNGELVGNLMDRGDGYFHWLQKVSGLSGPLSSMLAETEFVSKDGIDDILVEKATEEVRRKYAEEITEKDDLNDEETETIYKSIRGDCCLFEVMVCLADSINEMFEDSDAYDGCEHFFGILLKNAGMDLYDEEDCDIRPEKVKAYWQKRIDIVVKREYSFYGVGGFFPLDHPDVTDELYICVGNIEIDSSGITDRRKIPLWQQMQDWVDQHTNEDGEWVD